MFRLHFAALTKCENKRLEIKYRHSDEISVVPRCNKDGSFAEIQCSPRVNKCWCVDEHGRERNSTRQTGKPTNCKASGPGKRYFVIVTDHLRFFNHFYKECQIVL